MAVALVLLTLGLAFANGANDVSKGIATLVGSGVTDYRRSILWGTAWTIAGGAVAAFTASELVATFSGKGLLAEAAVGPAFLIAVAGGAIGWLIVATATGLPVSTTHALVGGLCGAGIAAAGFGGVEWPAVARKAALPLGLSPIISLGLMAALFPGIRLAYRRFDRYCVCLERREVALAVPVGVSAVAGSRRLTLLAGADCPPQVVSRVGILDSLHWLSSGLASLCRGVNDSPKILAIGLAAAAATGYSAPELCLLVAFAMGAGSCLQGLRVTTTLAERLTPMAPGEGFAANLVTSVLVAAASLLALPVSTTHVSSSAIVAIGLHNRHMQWHTLRDMLLAWLVTLPIAGAIAWLIHTVVG